MAFTTTSDGVCLDAHDRIVRRYRTACTGCGVVVVSKDERAAHVCASKGSK